MEKKLISRTRNYINQVKGSFIYKLIGVSASFLCIPLTIEYLGQEKFGIWATLLSIITWMIFFDFGIGLGLKNMAAESLTKGDYEALKINISTAYSVIGILVVILLLIYLPFTYVVSWQKIFNTIEVEESALRLTLQICGVSILLNLWFNLINSLLGAFQKNSLILLNQAFTSVLTLILIYVFLNDHSGDMPILSLVYGITLCVPNLISSAIFFYREPQLIPSYCIDRELSKKIVKTGAQFFIIQISVVFTYLMDKILITQIFGPKSVVDYEIIFKIFTVIILLNSLVATPLWSAYTDAYHRNEYKWIMHMKKKQNNFYIGVFISTLVMIFLAKPIVLFWIGGNIEVSYSLVIAIAIYTLIITWNYNISMLINGIGIIRLQTYVAIFSAFINIPLAYLFTMYFHMGVPGVIYATCVSLIFTSIILPLQVNKIFKKYIIGLS